MPKNIILQMLECLKHRTVSRKPNKKGKRSITDFTYGIKTSIKLNTRAAKVRDVRKQMALSLWARLMQVTQAAQQRQAVSDAYLLC